jgi:hypothetical protein
LTPHCGDAFFGGYVDVETEVDPVESDAGGGLKDLAELTSA